jgi:alkylation response protein AidB-like acyl-CoA dehydrogenase
MSTVQQAPARPKAGIDLEDPFAVAAELRDQFRVGAAERDRKREFPYEQCDAFRASGLLGLMVPREYGGYGGTFSELMRVVILISAGDSNIGQMYQLHTGGIRLLEEFAPPAVQAQWLPRFASGELWIANAYSEIGTPSVNDFNTTVSKVDDGWLLNGTKFYCTGSLAGDVTFGPLPRGGLGRGARVLHQNGCLRCDDPRRLERLRPAHDRERHDRFQGRVHP